MKRVLGDSTVLFVEDEPEIRKTFSSILAKHCKRVISAADGKEGVALFKSEVPDLVVTDLRLPKMDGFAMIKAIKESHPHTPFVVISAFSDAHDFTEAIRLKVHHYLIKPIDVEEMLEVLEAAASGVVRQREIDNLQQLLGQYKDAVDAGSIVSKTDSRGVITYANDAFCRVSGYSEEELLGRPHNIVRHPDMPASAFKEMWDTIRDKRIWKGIVKNLRKDGGSYWVDATIIPIQDADGRIVEYIGVRHDITELEEYRQILEEQLDVSIQSISTKINDVQQIEKAINAGTAYSRTTKEGVFIFGNDIFCDMLGFSQEELPGREYGSIARFDEGQRERIRRVVHAKQEMRDTIRYQAKDGSLRYLDSAFVSILDLNGEIREVMGIHHDVTDIITLNQEIEATQKEVLETMGAISETRSKETGAHVKRVAEYSYLLALKYGLDESEAALLKTASPMHDIGKVGIPDSILNKPGALTPEEYELIKGHTTVGNEMLKNSQRPILKAAATVAHEHHEKWDGSGYPRGLKGDAIHIFGRITAVADVFDALGHDRVYKKAWDLQKILALFQEERGRHFDPDLVDLFMANLEEILVIKARFDNQAQDSVVDIQSQKSIDFF